MSLPTLPFMLVFSVVQGTPSPGTMDCAEIQHIELTRLSDKPTEVCVSPHLLTGFSFDAPVSVELQDETRFEEVARGRTSIHVLPPKDLGAGERIRLSVTFLEGEYQETFFLVLVGASGRSTRQVEVHRHPRTRESLETEIKLERTRNQMLQDELIRLQRESEQLRTNVQNPQWLGGLIFSGAMPSEGISVGNTPQRNPTRTPGEIKMQKVLCYRSLYRVAMQVLLHSLHPEPWLAVTAEVWDEGGQHAKWVSLWQSTPLLMNQVQKVVVEAEWEVPSEWPKGTITLRLREEGPRDVLILDIQTPPAPKP